VDTLARRVDALAASLDELRSRDSRTDDRVALADSVPVIPMAPDEEPPAGRVSVPPVTAATISNHAFDVLLGSVSGSVSG
jgi:hypothetical protein